MKTYKCILKFERDLIANDEDDAYKLFADMISNIDTYGDYIAIEEEINEKEEFKADLLRKYDLDDLDGSKQENFCN